MMDLGSLNVEAFGAALVLWLVAAIVIEEAAGALFGWKLYKERLGGKGLKIPIIFIASYLICYYFSIDIFLALIAPVGIEGTSNWISIGVSALLLTGGSGSVFKVLNRIREGQKQLAKPAA